MVSDYWKDFVDGFSPINDGRCHNLTEQKKKITSEVMSVRCYVRLKFDAVMEIINKYINKTFNTLYV